MAIVQTDGVSSVTSTSTVNNGGVMTANGTAASNVLRSESTATEQVGVFASTVIDNSAADKALSAGTFAYNNAVPTAPKITTTVAGTSNDFLRSAANDPASLRSINRQETVRTQRITTAIRANKWNEYSGTWEAGFPVDASDTFWDISQASGVTTSTDDAASPTRSVPGELTYLEGNPVPKNDVYKAKTN